MSKSRHVYISSTPFTSFLCLLARATKSSSCRNPSKALDKIKFARYEILITEQNTTDFDFVARFIHFVMTKKTRTDMNKTVKLCIAFSELKDTRSASQIFHHYIFFPLSGAFLQTNLCMYGIKN